MKPGISVSCYETWILLSLCFSCSLWRHPAGEGALPWCSQVGMDIWVPTQPPLTLRLWWGSPCYCPQQWELQVSLASTHTSFTGRVWVPQTCPCRSSSDPTGLRGASLGPWESGCLGSCFVLRGVELAGGHNFSVVFDKNRGPGLSLSSSLRFLRLREPLHMRGLLFASIGFSRLLPSSAPVLNSIRQEKNLSQCSTHCSLDSASSFLLLTFQSFLTVSEGKGKTSPLPFEGSLKSATKGQVTWRKEMGIYEGVCVSLQNEDQRSRRNCPFYAKVQKV